MSLPESQTEAGIGIVVHIHPVDFQMLETAAGAMKTDITDFAALAIYRQSRDTILGMGLPFPRAIPSASDDDHDRPVSRTSA